MESIKRIKNIILIMAIIILGILGITSVSQAYDTSKLKVGSKVTITMKEYLTDYYIYCMEHHQYLGDTQNYKVISKVDILGNKSTDQEGNEIENPLNARMAYIFSQAEKNGSVKYTGPVANAIWNISGEWMNQVGKKHAGLYAGFTNGVKGDYSSWVDTGAKEYAESIKDLEFTDNTNKSKIKAEAYERNGRSYIRVGPFNWTFPGALSEINVKNQNEETIEGVQFSTFNGNTEVFTAIDKLESKTDFYVSIPADKGVSRITGISAKSDVDLLGVSIWFLRSDSGSTFQNLIIGEPNNGSDELEEDFDYDIPLQGNLKIIKVNQDNEEIKLQGVGFYIQHQQTGKYVRQNADGTISYVNKEDATEFVTDQNGEILVKNLLVGTYVAYETKNPNYGYEIVSEGQQTNVVVDKTTEFKIGNKQIYIKLSGYVWVDKIYGKQSLRNDLFKDNDYDKNDILLEGITVRLKDTDGNTIKEATTDKEGSYLFTDVLIEDLDKYYIEFEYDGLTYTNVVPHIDKDNGSKAAENENTRKQFNQGFATVEGGDAQNKGITRNPNGEKVHDLTYKIENYTATLIHDKQYLLTANTNETGYRIVDHFEYGMEEIKYNNLGLYEREQPQLGISKDLDNVKLTINGYEHIYGYSQKSKNSEYNDSFFNVGVKFKVNGGGYTRAIYEADYTYENPEDPSKELKTYLTYEINLRNLSTNLYSKVNSIIDYYDSRYNLVAIGRSLDEQTSTVSDPIEYEEMGNYNDEYKKLIIYTNSQLAPQTQTPEGEKIYVQFELNRQAVLEIMNDGETLDNVTEINSYSTYSDNTYSIDSIYAGIDVASNPANAKPDDKSTFELDTDSSPSVKLEIADARRLTGTVFEDSTGDTALRTGQERLGNGILDEGENGISGVQVTFTENTGSGKTYEATTDENGNFEIRDYIPGDYTLTYTWGDNTYTVQNYKGTIYNNEREQGKEWYKTDVDTRYSDAIDNYNQDQEAPKGSRLQIDEEMATLNKDNANDDGTRKDYTRTKMDSTTPTMGIGIEYDSTTTDSAGDRYEYTIRNLDFGIALRPQQQIDIAKRIKSFKVTLSNSQVIIDTQIAEDGTLTGTTNGVTYMPPSETTEPKNGFVRFELDSELMEGAKLEATYEIKATNSSEKDYLNETYYKYGKGDTSNEATITPSGVVDYLDTNWAYDESLNPGWELKTQEELKDLVAKVVYESENAQNSTILYTDDLATALKAGEQTSKDLITSVILSSTKDVTFDNDVEIVEIDRPGGSEPPSTPGNHIPGTGKDEPDDDPAETLIPSTNTGANLNFLVPLGVGISALIILGAGVVLIKKKILNK